METTRLKLIPFEKSHLDTLHDLFSHPFIRKYLWDDKVVSRQQTEDILKQNEAFFDEHDWGLFSIFLKDNPNIIGFTGLWPFFEEPQPQLLFGLLPEYTGQGLAYEAAQKMIEYAQYKLGFKFLAAATDAPNLPSQKVLDRIGMKKTKEQLEKGKPTFFYKIDFA